MKTILTFSVVLLASTSSLVAEEAKTLLRDGIFAEEAKKDHQTAIQKYELLLKQFKEDRKIVVVALYRLAEIQRKEGKKKQAAKLYYRLLEEFPNMEPHTTMSRKKLIALGEKLPEKKTAPFDEEEKELARLKKIEITSPDLFRDPRNIENAAKNNWLRVINYLVKKGTDVNQSGALFNAVDFGHLTACKILLDAGCDPNSKKNSKALEFAFHSGYTEIMKLLIKSGADLKGENGNWVPANTDEDTTLSNINILIKGGYNIDTISPVLNTYFKGKGGGLIHQAAIFNRIDLLDFLLKKNANINLASPNSGTTALHIAAYRANKEHVFKLINAGANVSAKLSDKVTINRFKSATPLQVLINQNTFNNPDRLACAKLLLEAEAIIPKGSLALFIHHKKKDWVKLFLEHGANPNYEDKNDPYDVTPLHQAAKSNQEEIVHLLIKHGATLKKDTLRHSKPEFQIMLMRKYFYPGYFKRKGITLTIPEARFETVLNIPNMKPNTVIAKEDIIAALSQAMIPAEYRSGTDIIGVTALWDMDQAECRLYIAEKGLLVDLTAKKLPSLMAGDVIEFTNFSKSKQRNDSRNKKPAINDKNYIPFSSSALAPLLKGHIKPVK